MEINDLARGYNSFVEKRPTLTGQEAVQEARKLLQVIRDAGRYVGDPQQREILSAWARDLGDTIYKNTGEYPAVRIVPLEIMEITPTWIARWRPWALTGLVIIPLLVIIALLISSYLSASQPPVACILQPSDDSLVPYDNVEVRGSYAGNLGTWIFRKWHLWVIVRPLESGLYYPQKPVKMEGNTWSVRVRFGRDIPEEEEIGKRFAVILYSADNQADQILQKYVDDALATDNWPGLLSLPPGLTELHLVTVTKIVVQIRQPDNGDSVPYKMKVSGHYEGNLAGWKLWVLVHPKDSDRYYPQRPTDIDREEPNTWSVTTIFGQDTPIESGKKFEIIVYLADSQADGTLREYVNKAIATDNWPGLLLPSGLTEFHRVTVTRR